MYEEVLEGKAVKNIIIKCYDQRTCDSFPIANSETKATMFRFYNWCSLQYLQIPSYAITYASL